jgi:hypothetical protein
MDYNSFAWVPLAVGLTVLGLVLSYITYQRRGLRPALLGVAWSLLPIAALMTGAIEMLWKVAVAIGDFATGFVFSPEKWAGIGVTALAIGLFLAAGGRQRRRAAREARKAAQAERADSKDAAAGRTGTPEIAAKKRTADPVGTALTQDFRTPVPAARSTRAAGSKSAKSAPADDDDMRDIEDILRKRGL